MKKQLVIFHFLPIELFPPILNIIDYIATQKDKKYSITLYTTHANKTVKEFNCDGVTIIKFKGINPNDNGVVKLFKYFGIYFNVLKQLFQLKPKHLIYFETLSSLPCVIYKQYYKNVILYAHYHELVTLKELNKGRTLNKLLNKLEATQYKKYYWISQTNEQRLRLFLKQYNLDFNSKIHHTLPNYPPYSWLKALNHSEKIKQKNLIKLVHIGSLSTKGMYLKNLLQQFGNNSNFSMDFYSHKFTDEITELISRYNNCFTKGAIAYQDIPKLKGLYDVGLVLYNGSSLNFTYNAPNKIFEYLALDLDVWCSNKLITAKNYERLDCYPKMIMVDYEKLEEFNVEETLDKKGLKYVQSPYVCEPVYDKLINEIDEDFNT